MNAASHALAPGWARLVIGMVAGAVVASAAVAFAKTRGATPDPAVYAVMVAAVYLGATACALAADLDRQKPRWRLALNIGAVNAFFVVIGMLIVTRGAIVFFGGVVWLLGPTLLYLLYLPPWCSGMLRAYRGSEPRVALRGFVCASFAATVFALGQWPVTLLSLHGGGGGGLMFGGEGYAIGALLGLALTAGLVGSGIDLARVRA